MDTRKPWRMKIREVTLLRTLYRAECLAGSQDGNASGESPLDPCTSLANDESQTIDSTEYDT